MILTEGLSQQFYTYNYAGQIVRQDYTDLSGSSSDVSYIYTYNEAGLLATEEEFFGNRSNGVTTYTYDEHGNLTSLTNSRSGLPIPMKNAYDEQGHLVRVDVCNPMDYTQFIQSTVYTYDGDNVVKEEHYSYDEFVSITTLTYNEAGLLVKEVSESAPTDENPEGEVISTTTYEYADIDISFAPYSVQAVAGDGNTIVVTWEGTANAVIVDGKRYAVTGNTFTTPVLIDGTYTVYVVNNGNATAAEAIDVFDNTKVGVSDVRLDGDITVTFAMEENSDGELVEVTYYNLPVAWTLPAGAKPTGYRIYYNSTYYVDIEDGTLRHFIIPARDIKIWSMQVMGEVILPFVIRIVAIYETGEMEPVNTLELDTESILNMTPIGLQYTLTYLINGELYKTYKLINGSPITPEEPQKEGYTFSGWSEIPETMPDHDVIITGSFIPKKYTVTFEIDGNVYETRTIDYGSTIVIPELPELTGYTFKWDNVPTTMPAKDITIEGRYVPNTYSVTYWIDDVKYKVVNVQYGTEIVAETNPEKEGYTFSGWSDIPNTMPAHDVVVIGSFTINTYKVIYEVNGEVYKTYEVDYGGSIPVEEALESEGYIFSGWSVIPATMPAHDVVITASFTKGEYKLIYVVDGEVYKIYGYDFQDEITLEAVLEKEGYTFSGWSEIPETMPAHDVAVTGTFTINQYTISFKIGENVYETITLNFGAEISVPEVPELTGYTFTWGEVLETMPAKDLTIIGEYVPNKYNVTYLIDGIFYSIMKVPYGSAITPPEAPERDGCTFTWIDVPETMPAHDITIEGTYTDGIGLTPGPSPTGERRIYNLSGQRLSKPKRGVNIINGKKAFVK